MSTNYSSPGITVTEIDKSLSVDAASVTIIGSVGEFSWGQAFKPVYVSDETSLQNQLGKPIPFNAIHYTAATDALSYTKSVLYVRTLNTATAKNASLLDAKTGILIENRDAFSLMSNATKTGHKIAAKYAGTLGNSIKISVADSNTFENWEYAYLFSAKPETSHYARDVGAKNDEMHIVIVDKAGLFTGIPNTILETYEFVSKARDSRTLDLRPNYWVSILNEQSKYVYVMGNPLSTEYDTTTVPEATDDWGSTLLNGTTGQLSHYKNLAIPQFGEDGTNPPSKTNLHSGWGGLLAGGTLGDKADDNDYIRAWDVFKNAEDTAASVLFMGAISDEYNIRVTQHVIDKIISVRKDAVLTISPRYKDISNKSNTDVIASLMQYDKDLNRESSYVFRTTNWFLEYEQHTDENYWIPDNIGTAGIMARTDEVAEPWYSPAGYLRGVYKNVVKTLWNPSENDADIFYKNAFNRVTNIRGSGVVLFGDRTLLTRPSALRMIGVRRLLIQLKKLISDAAKYTLFEFNDSITRNQFVALVRPYLLQVQAARGLDSFQIVCDESNNTGQVLNEQRFVADIYIRPLYSINRINLNFILVNNTISFSEAIK